jgi:hypothetical protein
MAPNGKEPSAIVRTATAAELTIKGDATRRKWGVVSGARWFVLTVPTPRPEGSPPPTPNEPEAAINVNTISLAPILYAGVPMTVVWWVLQDGEKQWRVRTATGNPPNR